MFRTSNPILNDDAFSDSYSFAADADAMSLNGTVLKTGLLLLLTAAAAVISWNLIWRMNPAAVYPLLLGGIVVGLIVSMIAFHRPTAAPIAGPIYALAEGLVLGALSSLIEAAYPGIAFQAICLTFAVLLSLLIAYASGLIRATENFKLGVVAATGGIFVVYAASWILRLFGTGIPYIHEAGTVGILFSVFVVVIAALNLVLDFDFIEDGVRRGAPKHMEWYAALGLLVTLVWLYLEILRLLMKARSRN